MVLYCAWFSAIKFWLLYWPCHFIKILNSFKLSEPSSINYYKFHNKFVKFCIPPYPVNLFLISYWDMSYGLRTKSSNFGHNPQKVGCPSDPIKFLLFSPIHLLFLQSARNVHRTRMLYNCETQFRKTAIINLSNIIVALSFWLNWPDCLSDGQPENRWHTK